MTTAREAIAKAYKEFEEAFYNGEADTISRMDTEDAELLIPEAPIVRGREAIGQVWASILEVNTPAGNVLSAGKYIVIWKRQSTGERKIHRDIFNRDIPPVQTSTP